MQRTIVKIFTSALRMPVLGCNILPKGARSLATPSIGTEIATNDSFFPLETSVNDFGSVDVQGKCPSRLLQLRQNGEGEILSWAYKREGS